MKRRIFVVIAFCPFLLNASVASAIPTSSDEPTQIPAGMVPIPAGSFQMGCATTSLFDCSEARFAHEIPLHTVHLDSYYIDIHEVTNSQYAKCVAGGVCDPPQTYTYEGQAYYNDRHYPDPQYGNYPVVLIPWTDANSYCTWMGKSLPTEAQWEKAARGSSDTRIWPWGNTPADCSLENYWRDTANNDGLCGTALAAGTMIRTSEVGSHPLGASPYGVMDMAGNVYEFVMDYMNPYYYEEYDPDAWPANPIGEVGVDKAVRGGGWNGSDVITRVSYRSSGGGTDGRGINVGFRCASLPNEIHITQGKTALPPETPSIMDDKGLFPMADSHVYAYSYSGWNKANWGKYEALGAGWHPTGGEKRAYLRFDLSGVDPNRVARATLRLFHHHTGGGNSLDLGVYRVTSPWVEGNGTYKPSTTAGPGEITWVNQPTFYPRPLARFNPGPGTDRWVEVDVTLLVKAWLAGTSNNGLMLKAEGSLSARTPEAQYGFRSRESEVSQARPVLVLSGGEPDADIDLRASGIVVESATYGGNCGVVVGNVTTHIASQCNEESSCQYTVDHRIIGDPAGGCAKTYSVRYRCGDNPQVVEISLGAEAGWGDKAVVLECRLR